MKKLAGALFALLAFAGSAVAQTSPNFSPGQVPTAGEWNALFASKADYLGSPALPTGGGTMTGELITAASAASGAGFNLPPGADPTSPVNGDMWMTSAGLFIRVANSTIGPLGLSACSGCALTNVTNTFVAQQIFNLNATALPAALAGTIFNLGGADATVAREQLNAFGGIPTFSGVTYGGTGASKTAVGSGVEIGTFNAWAYNGASLTTTAIAAFHMYTAEVISAGHQGSKACIATTPTASATIADGLCQNADGGIVIGSPTGGDKGAGTINASAPIYVNGVQLAAGGTVNAGTAGQLGYYATTSSSISPTANFTISGSTLTLGVTGSALGALSFVNLSSGSITLQAPTGVLGTQTLTLPDVTDTIAVLGAAQTFSGAINFSSTVSVGGNLMTFPGVAATIASLTTADQTLSGGANVVSQFATPGGTIAAGNSMTIDCGINPLQYMTTTGVSAVTINAPVNDGSCLIDIVSSFQPVFAGFTVGSTVGDPWANTPTHMVISVWRINGVSSYLQKAI